MRLTLKSLCLAALCLPAFSHASPEPNACPDFSALVSGGAELFALTAGAKARLGCAFEAGVRGGIGPHLWSLSTRANMFFDNPDPRGRATWFAGPEYYYYHEDGEHGNFRLGYLNIMLGREHRWTEHLRFDYEGGLGALLFKEFHGGGAPILLPVMPQARAEIQYQI